MPQNLSENYNIIEELIKKIRKLSSDINNIYFICFDLNSIYISYTVRDKHYHTVFDKKYFLKLYKYFNNKIIVSQVLSHYYVLEHPTIEILVRQNLCKHIIYSETYISKL